MITKKRILKLIDILSLTSDGAYSIDDSISKLFTFDLVDDLFRKEKLKGEDGLTFWNWNKAVNILVADYKANGIEQIAKLIYRLSLVYCPINTGNLRDHSYIELDKNNITCRIIYDAEYAAYVHEIQDNYHKFPTRSKFLEDAAYEVYNHIQIPGKTPLFTFQMRINDDGSICLEVNNLDVEQFIRNKEIREHFEGWFIDD